MYMIYIYIYASHEHRQTHQPCRENVAAQISSTAAICESASHMRWGLSDFSLRLDEENHGKMVGTWWFNGI